MIRRSFSQMQNKAVTKILRQHQVVNNAFCAGITVKDRNLHEKIYQKASAKPEVYRGDDNLGSSSNHFCTPEATTFFRSLMRYNPDFDIRCAACELFLLGEDKKK